MNDYPRRRVDDQDPAMAPRPVLLAEPDCGCFADEVAVDFPSIADAIERLRRSFLGSEKTGEPMCAELRLSAREACEGAAVALDVPVRSTCPQCGGRGESWLEPCPGCAGSGTWQRPQRVQVSVPPGIADGTRFRLTITAPCTSSTLVDVHIAVR